MRKILPLIIIIALLSGCFSTDRKRESDIDIAILNSTKFSDDTKREILRARYLERSAKQQTQHDPAEYRPVVDPQSCKNCPYDKDLATCSNLARENTDHASSAISTAAATAGAAALIGAVIGADIGTTAAAGATAGGLTGLASESITYRQMIARCMTGRGYTVLR